MLTESSILAAAGKFNFGRGESLIARDCVHVWDESPAEANPAVRVLNGKVKDGNSPTSAVQQVSVVANIVTDKVLSFDCTCDNATLHATQMCKHAVALALSYTEKHKNDAPIEIPAPAEPAEPAAPADDAQPSPAAEPAVPVAQLDPEAPARPQLGSRSQVKPAPKPLPQIQTATSLSNLMYTLAEDQSPSLAVESSPEFTEFLSRHARPKETTQIVELTPIISPSNRTHPAGAPTTGVRSWDVRFTIHNDSASYNVRSIEELVKAWLDGAEYSHGRNLTFVHDRGAFSERAAATLDLISTVVGIQRAFQMHDHTSNSSAPLAAKTVALDEPHLCDLLDLYVGEDVMMEFREYDGRYVTRTMSVCDSDPKLKVSIETLPKGGANLNLPKQSDGAWDGERLYVMVGSVIHRCSAEFNHHLGVVCRRLLPHRSPLHIRNEDLPAFCETVLPLLERYTLLALPEGFGPEEAVAPSFVFSFSKVNNQIDCKARVRYGEQEFILATPLAEGQPFRDMPYEKSVAHMVDAYFPDRIYAQWSTVPTSQRMADNDTERLYFFLSEGLAAFSTIGEVDADESLSGIRIRTTPQFRVAATIKSGLLEVAVNSTNLTQTELMAYLAAYEAKERFVRLESGDIIPLDAEGLSALSALAHTLGTKTTSFAGGGFTMPTNRSLLVDAVMKQASGIYFDHNEAFDEVIDQFNSLDSASFPIPSNLQATLRPYQEEGFRWLCTLAKLGFGGILADDMGLGKTIQMISFLLSQHVDGQDKPSLIVCPASVVYNWVDEIGRFAPDLKARAVVGSKAERGEAIREADDYDVLITSYELLKRDMPLYEGRSFYCEILDEAQYIKNHTTQAARCTKRISANLRFALTGTPIENRLGELWSIFDFLMPDYLSSYESFRGRFELPIASGDAEVTKRLQLMVTPFILRRMKTNVLKDLPEKVETIVYAHMEDEQLKLYQATAAKLAMELRHQLPSDFAHQRIAVLAELMRLRQICCDPNLIYDDYEGQSSKLEACMDLVDSAIDGDHKVLIFSQFTSMLALIGKRLESKGIKYHELIGSTPKEERANLVQSFAHDDVPIFLISLKAGGVGLNLAAADIVIHYDPWWNLAAQNQATDRAHRIGQNRNVTVMRLIAKDTIEEKILKLQEAKRDLAEQIIDNENAHTSTLTREDILALLEA